MIKSIPLKSERTIKLGLKKRNTFITTYKGIKLTSTNPLIKIELSNFI